MLHTNALQVAERTFPKGKRDLQRDEFEGLRCGQLATHPPGAVVEGIFTFLVVTERKTLAHPT
jgi:hypothetical protein